MRVLKVSIVEKKLRFLFFDGTTHLISNQVWNECMKSIYYEHHKVLLIRKESPESDRIVFSQANN